MSVIVAIRNTQAAVVSSDSQYVSSKGESLAPYDKTFQINHLIGAHCGLLEFAGLDVKSHIANALGDTCLSPIDLVRIIAAHMCPILSSVSESEIAFQHRCLDIIVASRARIASLRLFPNMQTLQIDTEYNENKSWLTAGSDPAKANVVKTLSRQNNFKAYGNKLLPALAKQTIESAIGVGGQHPIHTKVASCCIPACLRHIP